MHRGSGLSALCLTVFWAGAIYVLSHIPNLESGLEQDFLLRKFAHVGMYAVLSYLTARALFHVAPSRIDAVLGALWLTFAYAWTDEVHQLFVVGRSGSIRDVAIDTVGIMLGLLCWYGLQTQFFRRRQGVVAQSETAPSDQV